MSEEAGLQYCGNNATPPTVTTSNPRLLMVFDGRGHRAGRGFSASYQFITGQLELRLFVSLPMNAQCPSMADSCYASAVYAWCGVRLSRSCIVSKRL